MARTSRTGSGRQRNTTQRDRDRRLIANGHPDCGSEHHVCSQQHPPCGICGEPIDYTLPYLDPGEFVVDHVIPVRHGGADVLTNKQAAHRSCNRDKSDKIAHQAGITYVTERCWWE